MAIKISGIAGVIIGIKLQQILIVDTIIADLRRATPVDTGRARAGWQAKGFKIINEVPYITELNRGSSKQSPSHFVEKTLSKYR